MTNERSRGRARRRLGALGIVAIAAALVGCASDATSTPDESAAAATSTSTSLAALECEEAPSTGASTLDVEVDGRSYPTDVYRPDGSGSTLLPAVIDLHGLDADGPTESAMTGFRSLADDEGFVVAEPSGEVVPLGVTGWEIAALDEPDRDDIGAIGRLIDLLVDEQCVDPARVFVAGYSNGGFLAAELGCSARVEVAGVAAVAGFHAPEGCERHVPTIVMHGTDDPIVPLGPDGTSIIVDDTTPASVEELLASSIEDEVAASAADAGCDPTPTSSELAAAITESIFENCADGADHRLILIDGGGHTWPGAAPTADADFLGPTTDELDATETIWAFFADR